MSGIKLCRLRRVWVVAAVFPAVGLSGCTHYIVRPPTPSAVLTQNGPAYADAAGYVESARTAIDKGLRDVDNLEMLTKVGVGGGLAGAGTAAAFGANSDAILGFLTLGALSYSASAFTDPQLVGQILNAGLSNLDCIESAGEQAGVALAGQRYMLSQRRAVISDPVAKLRNDIEKASAEPDKYGIQLSRARESLAAGELALGAIDYYLTHSPISREMIRATRRTIYAVNQQLRERTPSIDTIARSGSILGTFLSSGAAIQTSAQAGASKIAMQVAAHDGAHPLNDDLVNDQNDLKAALETVGSLDMPAVSVASIAQCQAQFAAAAPLTLLSATPIELNAGATVILRTISGASAVPNWSSEIPADVTWNQEIGVLSMTARADAKTMSYKLRLADFAGHTSDEFTLNVHAANPPAAGIAAGGGNNGGGAGVVAGAPVGGGGKGPPPPPPGGH